jgi:hypothetical protein
VLVLDSPGHSGGYRRPGRAHQLRFRQGDLVESECATPEQLAASMEKGTIHLARSDARSGSILVSVYTVVRGNRD